MFVGLMISLGSSGVVNQMMSSFMITYSRALKVGDYVRVGDVEGTVTHMGMLSTKVKTPKREEVTIPNSVLVSNTTTNFSKFAESDGVYVPTSVTIGYDVPWRQVEGAAADWRPIARRVCGDNRSRSCFRRRSRTSTCSTRCSCRSRSPICAVRS